MLKYKLCILLVSCLAFAGMAQCPDTGASVAAQVCLDENIPITIAAPADSYAWDFCADELSNFPQTEGVLTATDFGWLRAVSPFEDRGQKYLACVNNAPRTITILGFGDSYFNTPVVIGDYTVSALTQSPYDLEVVIENDQRYIFLVASDEQTIERLDFGSSWFEPPQTGGFSYEFSTSPHALTLQKVNGAFYFFVSLDKAVARLDFGTDITNINPAYEALEVSGADELRQLDFVQECGQYVGMVSSYRNTRLFRLGFDSPGVAGNMIAEQMTNTTGTINNPAGLSMAKEGDSTFLFVQSASGPLYKAAFDGLPSTSVAPVNYGNLGRSGVRFPFELIKEGPYYLAFSGDLRDRTLLRHTFPSACDADQVILTDSRPVRAYTTPGQKVISLQTTRAEELFSQTFTVDVVNSAAPPAAMEINAACAEDPVIFTYPENPAGRTISWDFGDGNSGTGAVVSHVYGATGTYAIRLEVSDADGCSNALEQEFTLLEDIAADFSSPGGIVCTFQEVVFVNESVHAPEGIASFEWFVNGVLVSQARDLVYEFPGPGEYQVTLAGSTGDCSDEKTLTVEVIEGPSPSFTFTEVCIGEPVTFTNTSTGNASGWQWDFGDGNTSALENPVHTYDAPGEYRATLTVFSGAGCASPFSQTVTVAALPSANFMNELACTEATVQFTDMSDPGTGNIVQWYWDFGEAGTSSVQNPAVVFEHPGETAVSLTVQTTAGCTATVMRVIDVRTAPEANFSIGPVCPGEPVQFTDESVPAAGTVLSEWAWDIGPGFSSAQHPVFGFPSPGSYDVALTVTASDQCSGTVSRTVVVPEAPDVRFVTSPTCAGEPVEFSDITMSDEPVVRRSWDFAGMGSASDSVTSATFDDPGEYQVTLEIETLSGCRYAATQPVEITAVPEPVLLASATAGAAPLAVTFTAAGIGEGVTVEWQVDGSVVSEATMFDYTFETPGEYAVTLAASDGSGCTGAAMVTISAEVPGVDLSADRVIESFTGLLLEITNHGNLPVSDIPVERVSNGTVERVFVRSSAGPGETVIVETPFGIPTASGYTCLRIGSVIQGFPDVHPGNNSTCVFVENGTDFSLPYPNPTDEILYIDVFTSELGELTAMWVAATGQQLPAAPEVSFNRTGIYTLAFDVSALEAGVYLLRVYSPGRTSVFRVTIQ